LSLDPQKYRATLGLCLGLRGGISSAVVVVACKRADPARTLYVAHEWEQKTLDVDAIAAAIKHARDEYHPVYSVGYYGGRDDEKIFKVLSIRLGQYIEPAPGDPTAPTQLLVDDFRSGRLRARADSLTVRDAKGAIWREGVPDQTGVLAALRCAHWAAQQYRNVEAQRKARVTGEQRTAAMAKERRRRMERPY